ARAWGFEARGVGGAAPVRWGGARGGLAAPGGAVRAMQAVIWAACTPVRRVPLASEPGQTSTEQPSTEQTLTDTLWLTASAIAKSSLMAATVATTTTPVIPFGTATVGSILAIGGITGTDPAK